MEINVNIGCGQPKNKIRIEGRSFTYIPHATNSTGGFQNGDLALDGWVDDTTFGKILKYNGGNPSLFSGWDLVESW